MLAALTLAASDPSRVASPSGSFEDLSGRLRNQLSSGGRVYPLRGFLCHKPVHSGSRQCWLYTKSAKELQCRIVWLNLKPSIWLFEPSLGLWSMGSTENPSALSDADSWAHPAKISTHTISLSVDVKLTGGIFASNCTVIPLNQNSSFCSCGPGRLLGSLPG